MMCLTADEMALLSFKSKVWNDKDRWNNICWSTNTQVKVYNTCLCSLVCQEWPGTQSYRNTGMFQPCSHTCHFCRDCHLMSTHLHLENNQSYQLHVIQNANSNCSNAREKRVRGIILNWWLSGFFHFFLFLRMFQFKLRSSKHYV